MPTDFAKNRFILQILNANNALLTSFWHYDADDIFDPD